MDKTPLVETIQKWTSLESFVYTNGNPFIYFLLNGQRRKETYDLVK